MVLLTGSAPVPDPYQRTILLLELQKQLHPQPSDSYILMSRAQIGKSAPRVTILSRR